MARWKKYLMFLLIFILFIVPANFFTGSLLFKSSNSHGLSNDYYIVENGRPMILIRNICSMIGAGIEWNKDTKEILCTKGIVEIKMALKSETVYVNGVAKSLDAAIQVKGGKALVPLSFPWKDMNIGVSWNAKKKSLTVTKGPIVFFGDSLTQGFGLKKYFTSGNLINKGVSANTTKDALKRVNDVIGNKPDKVFIMLGTNDIWTLREEEDIMDNYNEIINKIRSACPYVEIIVQSVLPMGKNALARNPDVSNKGIESLNTRIKDMVKVCSLKYVDIGILLKDKNGNMSDKYTKDGVHINSSAYDLWAKKIKDMVQ
ncbi:MAG TPA: GDSL-type esterase/lipase family protein [Pseudobacteroides sp.]|uniref:GDSL-type esterase/lipase family protein n=1 Tax=Pseudobacteroides sp. TaxID=1968840 RepID=UPI002F9213A5